MPKTLKTWHGRGWGHRTYDENKKLVYDPTGIKYCDGVTICAYSRAEAVRIANEAAGRTVVSDSELKNYHHCNDWDEYDKEKGILKEIGVYTYQWIGDKPKRIYPRER